MTLPRFAFLPLMAAFLFAGPGPEAEAGPALDRIVAEKHIRLGVRTDAPPFAAVVDDRPVGFSVDLCGQIAAAIALTSKIEGLKGTLITVDTAERFDALTDGRIDILCGATTATLTRRETVSFSIPTFATGLGAIVAADAPDLLKEVLIDGGPASLSKAAVGEALHGKSVGVHTDTTAADWLANGPLAQIEGLTVTPVSDHAAGIAAVADGSIAAYFADRAILLGILKGQDNRADFAVSKVTFTNEPYALALPRGDEDLRLVVDRALSYLYRNGAILQIYQAHFGKPTAEVAFFYAMVAMPK